jgi:hypothetical protein
MLRDYCATAIERFVSEVNCIPFNCYVIGQERTASQADAAHKRCIDGDGSVVPLAPVRGRRATVERGPRLVKAELWRLVSSPPEYRLRSAHSTKPQRAEKSAPLRRSDEAPALTGMDS